MFFNISLKSIKTFASVNSLLSGIGAIAWTFRGAFIGTFIEDVGVYANLLIGIPVELAKNAGLVEYMHYKTLNKPDEPNRKETISTCDYARVVLIASAIKSLTHNLLIWQLSMNHDVILSGHSLSGHYIGYIARAMLFLGKSFAFELLFDLVHYTLHRELHSNKFLYRVIHKDHHRFNVPTPRSTFYMTPIDLILSYSVPLAISSYIIPFTMFEFYVITTFLTYQEIGGHIGRKMYPTSSFPMFVWLPRSLGIELYTEEHTAHHTRLNCNYSKRFTIWDRLFGTHYDIITQQSQVLDKEKKTN